MCLPGQTGSLLRGPQQPVTMFPASAQVCFSQNRCPTVAPPHHLVHCYPRCRLAD